MPGSLYRDSNHRVIWMEMLYKFIWGSFIERKMYVYMKLQIVMGIATKENRNRRHWDGYLLLELGSRWWALAHHHHPPALLPRLRFWPCWGMAMAPVEVKKLPEVLTREKLPTGHWRTRNFPDRLVDSHQGSKPRDAAEFTRNPAGHQPGSFLQEVLLNHLCSQQEDLWDWKLLLLKRGPMAFPHPSWAFVAGTRPPLPSGSLQWQSQLAKGKCLWGPAPGSQTGQWRGDLKSRGKELIPGIPLKGLTSSAGKESACNAGDPSLTPGSRRSTGEGTGYPLQDSCLENSMDRGAWGGYSPWGRTESDMTERLGTAHASP